MSEHTTVTVRAESPYDVVIGAGALGRLAAIAGGRRVLLIRPNGLEAISEAVVEALRPSGGQMHEIVVPAGEAAKTAAVAERCWAELGRAGATRSDLVIGLGGGATTDLASFVAATFLRGMRVVLVPTSLLAMVDAAVGGKTGINTAEGKNLVGAFHEPVAVVCDLDLLAGLPTAELVSGLGEVVKCGLIADRAILDLVAGDPVAAREPQSPVLRELVVRAVEVKAAVVSGDLRESLGRRDIGREMLNYGHTLAHAIERVEQFRFRHGDAVAIGLVYAAELAAAHGLLDDTEVALHRDLLASVGLPTSYRPGRWDDLRAAMSLDKKARGAALRFVVLNGIGGPQILEAPAETTLRGAYDAISA